MVFGQGGLIFVLWGEQFDELVAVIFITCLREVGLAVKVVGFNRRPAAGAHGLYLFHDLTLEQALALVGMPQTWVIPCGQAGAQSLINDPRIEQLFQQTYERPLRLFSTPVAFETLATLPGFCADACHVTLIPAAEHLLTFVEQVSRQLIVDSNN